ncbi:MAG: endonuclease/exonuclease/phosphatase family protein [Gemmatimonadaceae bacterium]
MTLSTAACRTGRNYQDVGPRYEGAPSRAAAADPARGDTLRIASFNIEFALRPDSALAVFRAESALARMDVVLLQEVDESATRRIAGGLGLGYVYYPAIFRNRSSKDFGNAVLSRWPIIADSKVILPHRSWYGGSQRTATAATIRIADRFVRVYSTHLGTPADITPSRRRQQIRAIIRDAEPHRLVIIGGDLNSSVTGEVARDAGYLWPTEKGVRTTRLGRWDHIFVKGLTVPANGSGTISNGRGTSDHLPVWAIVLMNR